MRHRRPARLATLLAAVACGPALHAIGPAAAQVEIPGVPTPAGSDPAPSCSAAALAYAEGRLTEAESHAAACSVEDAAAAGAVRLLLARIAIRRGRTEDALAHLSLVGGPERKYVAGYEDVARIASAAAFGEFETAREEDLASATARLEGATIVPGDDALEALRRRLLLRIDRVRGDRASVIRRAAALLALPVTATERAAVTEEVEGILADETALTEAEVVVLFDAVAADSPLRGALGLRRAALAAARGDLDTARDLVANLSAWGVAPDRIADLQRRIARVAAVDAGRIGALLPLTGPGAGVGARALAAMEVAAGGLRIDARDTASDDETTRRAVHDLASTARVAAIVGPIEARVARAAAAAAAEEGVPMIALNVQIGVASAERCVYRDFPTYESEIEALVDYAWNHARGRRFAVMKAEGRYGELLEEHLREALARRGAEVVHTGTYEADRTEFLDEARRLRRARPDAILFADTASRIALLAPALAFEGLWPQPHPHDPDSRAPSGGRREALYLLPSLAADPAALAEARRYVEGAVAAVGFAPAADEGGRTAFERRFVEAAGAPPAQVDAFAHDAVVVLAHLISNGAANRPALCAALGEIESAATVAPFAGFAPDGEARRAVDLRVIRDGVPTPTGAR